ncbi:MAG: NADH-quinone oxidoreductase subunit NuoE [Proteobacteria bacterium]|nr:NADH-quinone oxidoreductase subunit NuoE [Pseudomonadota bacterium]
MAFTLSAESERIVDELLTRYPTKRAACIPVLHLCQRQEGWVSPDVKAYVSKRLAMDPSEVHGVVTFYTMYHQERVARNVIWVCRTLSCELRGARAIQKHLEARLGCGLGGTSSDGKFTLLAAECLAACGQAPMIQLNDEYHENLTIQKLDAIVDRVASQTGSAPHPSLGVPGGRAAASRALSSLPPRPSTPGARIEAGRSRPAPRSAAPVSPAPPTSARTTPVVPGASDDLTRGSEAAAARASSPAYRKPTPSQVPPARSSLPASKRPATRGAGAVSQRPSVSRPARRSSLPAGVGSSTPPPAALRRSLPAKPAQAKPDAEQPDSRKPGSPESGPRSSQPDPRAAQPRGQRASRRPPIPSPPPQQPDEWDEEEPTRVQKPPSGDGGS